MCPDHGCRGTLHKIESLVTITLIVLISCRLRSLRITPSTLNISLLVQPPVEVNEYDLVVNHG